MCVCVLIASPVTLDRSRPSDFTLLQSSHQRPQVSKMALVVKNLPAKAGDPGETDLIPGLGRSPGGGHGNPLQDSCWRIPWTEEPGGLQSMGSQSQTRLKRLSTHTHKAPHSKFSSVLRGWGFSLQVWGATLQLMYLGTYSHLIC